MDSTVLQDIHLEIIIGVVANKDVQLDDTVPWNDQPPQGLSEPQPDPVTEPLKDHTLGEVQHAPVTLIIRRGHVLTDLMKAFTDPGILSTDFYERCTLGGDVKVPFFSRDYQSEDWQAVARILVVGWRIARYFPVKLAAPFLEEAL